MSILIDKLKNYGSTVRKIDEKWYIAKPVLNSSLTMKLKDCIKILTGKAIAVHFKEDEKER